MSEHLSESQINELAAMGCLSSAHFVSLMHDTNALPECKPNGDAQIHYGVAVSLTTAKPLLLRIAELEQQLEAALKDAERLRECARLVLEANPREWNELSEPYSQFERWAKNRIRWALDAAAIEASKAGVA